MHVFFSETQTRHSPQKFLMAGKVVAPFETPDRCRVLASRSSILAITACRRSAPCMTLAISTS
jgi:hypothetical protein